VKGPLQHVIKQLGAEIITKSAWLDFKAVAIDQTTGRKREVTNGELIGGNVVRLEPSDQSEAFCTDAVQVNFG
jgi:hypothetical protein